MPTFGGSTTKWDNAQDDTNMVHEQPTGTDFNTSSALTPAWLTNHSGLQAYWTFEEDSGTTIHDISGNGNDGTLTGGTLNSGVEFMGRSTTYFDKSGDDAFYSDTNIFNATDETAIIWFRFMDGSSKPFPRLYGAVSDTDPVTNETTGGWWVERKNTNYSFKTRTVVSNPIDSPNLGLTPNRWYCSVVRVQNSDSSFSWDMFDETGTNIFSNKTTGITRNNQNANYFMIAQDDNRAQEMYIGPCMVFNTAISDTLMNEIVSLPLKSYI